jgi:hypothetical protein
METDYNKAKQDESVIDRDLAKLNEEHDMLKE